MNPLELNPNLPELDGTIRVSGLDGEVEIFRDSYGIPHVSAQSTLDAYFGQGFVTAQDRLWQMEYDRLRGSGRWAEVAGISAREHDKTVRKFGLRKSAEQDYNGLDGHTQEIFQAYARGVNAFIQTTTTLPPEYALCDFQPETWEPWHGFIIYKIRHILMGVFESKLWRYKLLQELGPEKTATLFPQYKDSEFLILPPEQRYTAVLSSLGEDLAQAMSVLNTNHESDSGSNSWVISGSHTDTGLPFLAGDSHRALDTPNVYYQNHITCPEFDVIGLSFPGIPAFPHFGHNETVAWSVTHTFADYQDLYLEEFDPDDSRLYRTHNGWGNVAQSEEVLTIRDHGTESITVWRTEHGPIISGSPQDGFGLALRYTATDGPTKWAETLHKMLISENIDELKFSLRDWEDPCNNLLMADTEGNIGYFCRGHIPIRPRQNGLTPVPGWDTQYDWTGRIPFDELPSQTNPPNGFISTANNKPIGDEYPYFIGIDFALGYRIERINHNLIQSSSHQLADMKNIHSDKQSIPASVFRENVCRLDKGQNDITQAIQLLQAWDCNMDKDLVAPTLYSILRDHVIEELLIHNVGQTLYTLVWDPTDRGRVTFLNRFKALVTEHMSQNKADLLPLNQTWSDVLSRNLSKTVDTLSKTLGTDPTSWAWGNIHKAEPTHTLSPIHPQLAEALNPPKMSVSGDGDTPLAGSYAPANPARVTSLSVARYAYDLSDWDNSLWAVPLGASGIPNSPHYYDQSAAWQNLEMIPMYYNWQGIIANSQHHQTLQP